MIDFFILGGIGIFMGLFGGLLGIGGSIVMIPAMVFFFGEDQHLYQAAALICNFFVAGSSVIVHRKEGAIVKDVVKWLVPAAAFGMIAGVAISNSSVFARENSYLLARVFGVFLFYVVIYNFFRFGSGAGGENGMDISESRKSPILTILCGLMMGISGGLLGMGGGGVCVPAQQLFLKMPLKRAISNSAATIASVVLIGAFYKNMTLYKQGISVMDSIKIAVVVIPAAIIGGYIGGKLMHKLPRDLVRAIFIILALIAGIKMIMVRG